MRQPLLLLAGLLILPSLCSSNAWCQPSAISSHADLDWNAARRWVHVDNVDPRKSEIFESARKNWLAALRKDGHLLGDGRPLFWQDSEGKALTYFTFYPFGNWAEMDARREMADQTDKLVGEAAVSAYDAGDSALVPPHYSQMWRRAESFDIISPGHDSLTEGTATSGKLEFHQLDELRWDEFNNAWKEYQSALVQANYPLTCRVFVNMFGNSGGQYILFWLAGDRTQQSNILTPESAITRQTGEVKSAELLSTLDKIFPITESYDVRRRLDLSNLGK